MTNAEIEALIDEAHRVAISEKDPELLRRRLAYLLMPALERVEPVSWEVSTKGGRVSFRVANVHFVLDGDEAELGKDELGRRAEALRFALSRMQDGRPLKGG